MAQVVYFESSSNLKDLIGRRLVTNKISAIFELVKNSFDADARNISVVFKDDKLIISDDGEGMNLDDIREKWMVIGTDNKRGRNFTRNGRPLNGEKGIGRFSVDRLGRYLKMTTSVSPKKHAIQMEFDWEKFENKSGTKLSDIPIEYNFVESIETTGLVLEITGLRDEWTPTEIKNLEKRLRGLLSPVSNQNSHSFKITLDCKEFGFNEKELEPYDLSAISSLWIKMKVLEEDPNVISYSIFRNGAIVESKEYPNPYKFGPIELVIFSFDKGDKKSFYSKFNEAVKDFGNIRIYRDFFQIYPYGESYNDWLELDVRKAQGHYRFLGVRDLVGYLQISREHNPGFIDATNRQGLEENQSLQELRAFVKKEALPRLEEYFFFKATKIAQDEHKQNREQITNATKSLKSIAKDIQQHLPEKAKAVLELTKIIQDTNQKQDRLIREQKQISEVYKRLASKETLLHGIIHQVLIRLQSIETAVWNQRADLMSHSIADEVSTVLSESQNFILSTTKEINSYLLGARDYILKKREIISVNLYKQLESIFDYHKYTFQQNGISFNIEGSQQMMLKVDVNDLKVIFDNLISNSIKSLKKVEGRTRVIDVSYEITAFRLNIFFRDNGIGIDEDVIPHIFNPFYTTNADGFGMGLAIVDELIQNNNGEINLIIPRDGDVGAAFQLSFKLGG